MLQIIKGVGMVIYRFPRLVGMALTLIALWTGLIPWP